MPTSSFIKYRHDESWGRFFSFHPIMTELGLVRPIDGEPLRALKAMAQWQLEFQVCARKNVKAELSAFAWRRSLGERKRNLTGSRTSCLAQRVLHRCKRLKQESLSGGLIPSEAIYRRLLEISFHHFLQKVGVYTLKWIQSILFISRRIWVRKFSFEKSEVKGSDPIPRSPCRSPPDHRFD